MDEWLIRTAKNKIAGPCTRDRIRELIVQKQLQPIDEVCPGNGYWFSLNEVNEVQEKLGLESSFIQDLWVSEEKTKTQIELVSRTHGVETSKVAFVFPPQERRPFLRGAIWFLVFSLIAIGIAFVRLWSGLSQGKP